MMWRGDLLVGHAAIEIFAADRIEAHQVLVVEPHDIAIADRSVQELFGDRVVINFDDPDERNRDARRQ